MGRIISAFKQFFDDAGDPLKNGWLRFLESGTNNTDKATFNDSTYTIPNANPLQLNGAGRCPDVFGTGNYRVVSFLNDPEDEESPGEQVQVFDPVTAEGTQIATSGSSFGEWSSTVTYALGDLVTSNTVTYKSLKNANLNENPALYEESWEVVDFVHTWNSTLNYSIGNMVFFDGNLYFSLQDMNLNQQPDTSPTWWQPVISSVSAPLPEIYVTEANLATANITDAYITNAYITNADFLTEWPIFVNSAGGCPDLVCADELTNPALDLTDFSQTALIWVLVGPTGTLERYTLYIQTTLTTGGTITFDDGVTSTGALSATINAADLQTALEVIYGVGEVTVEKKIDTADVQVWEITFAATSSPATINYSGSISGIIVDEEFSLSSVAWDMLDNIPDGVDWIEIELDIWAYGYSLSAGTKLLQTYGKNPLGDYGIRNSCVISRVFFMADINGDGAGGNCILRKVPANNKSIEIMCGYDSVTTINATIRPTGYGWNR